MSAPDFSGIASAVDFSTVATAIVAIGALLMVPSVVRMGVSIILAMIDGEDPLTNEGWYERDDAGGGESFQTMQDESRNSSGQSYHDWNYWNHDGETFR